MKLAHKLVGGGNVRNLLPMHFSCQENSTEEIDCVGFLYLFQNPRESDGTGRFSILALFRSGNLSGSNLQVEANGHLTAMGT